MKKRIFVLDDEEDILEILSLVFTDAGYEVMTASSAEAAQNINAFNPDVILLDVRLQNSYLNGLDVCVELKKEAATDHTPVILISAEHTLDRLTRASGADDFVRKPFDIQELLQKVAAYV